VDDAFVFGKTAAANALSDVYAMGGKPILALAILGWPIDKLPASLANQVLEGARSICEEAGIPLAGGHSIDSPEPIFGLSVNGLVKLNCLKKNNTAKAGDLIFMTKALGTGILATASKRDVLPKEALGPFYAQLSKLNSIGSTLGEMETVTALTDVTGFGIMGHLIEMAEGSRLSAEIEYGTLPILDFVKPLLAQNIIPDATYRNWNAYGEKTTIGEGVNPVESFQILPDPQTNGGLLIAVHPSGKEVVQELLLQNGYGAFVNPIGRFVEQSDKVLIVKA
jgi:selenide,water dikinase